MADLTSSDINTGLKKFSMLVRRKFVGIFHT